MSSPPIKTPQSLHPRLDEAFERIDAAVFSGDTFDDPEARAYFASMLARWRKEIDE